MAWGQAANLLLCSEETFNLDEILMRCERDLFLIWRGERLSGVLGARLLFCAHRTQRSEEAGDRGLKC
jgi:hypothetical protein